MVLWLYLHIPGIYIGSHTRKKSMDIYGLRCQNCWESPLVSFHLGQPAFLQGIHIFSRYFVCSLLSPWVYIWNIKFYPLEFRGFADKKYHSLAATGATWFPRDRIIPLCFVCDSRLITTSTCPIISMTCKSADPDRRAQSSSSYVESKICHKIQNPQSPKSKIPKIQNPPNLGRWGPHCLCILQTYHANQAKTNFGSTTFWQRWARAQLALQSESTALTLLVGRLVMRCAKSWGQNLLTKYCN